MNEYTITCAQCGHVVTETWPDGHYMGERRDAGARMDTHKDTVHADDRTDRGDLFRITADIAECENAGMELEANTDDQ